MRASSIHLTYSQFSVSNNSTNTNFINLNILMYSVVFQLYKKQKIFNLWDEKMLKQRHNKKRKYSENKNIRLIVQVN